MPHLVVQDASVHTVHLQQTPTGEQSAKQSAAGKHHARNVLVPNVLMFSVPVLAMIVLPLPAIVPSVQFRVPVTVKPPVPDSVPEESAREARKQDENREVADVRIGIIGPPEERESR